MHIQAHTHTYLYIGISFLCTQWVRDWGGESARQWKWGRKAPLCGTSRWGFFTLYSFSVSEILIKYLPVSQGVTMENKTPGISRSIIDLFLVTRIYIVCIAHLRLPTNFISYCLHVTNESNSVGRGLQAPPQQLETQPRHLQHNPSSRRGLHKQKVPSGFWMCSGDEEKDKSSKNLFWIKLQYPY